MAPERTRTESNAALAAFEDYYQMGPGRSLRALAELYQRRYKDGTATVPTRHLTTLAEWSATFDWQGRVLERQREETEAARAAARKEAAALSRRRLGRAQLLQDAGAMILNKAVITALAPDEARELLAQAVKMLDTGMKAERLELGEATEVVRPTKDISMMDDAELDEYIAKLESMK